MGLATILLELHQMIVHNMIPPNGTWFKPYDLNYSGHEATRHYVALWNENYEGEVDYLYLCSMKLVQKKFLKEFNRHYVEFNSFVDKDLVYQILPRELVTLTVVEYTGKDFRDYKNYLNELEDRWWDNTALVGLKDIEKIKYRMLAMKHPEFALDTKNNSKNDLQGKSGSAVIAKQKLKFTPG